MTFTIPECWCGFIGATVFWFFVMLAVAAYANRKQKGGGK